MSCYNGDMNQTSNPTETARVLARENVLAILQQIGTMTVLSISGGRTQFNTRNANGEVVAVDLPVSSGYKVRIFLDASDTYTVQRVMVRGAKTFIKGTVENVYCEDISEVAYQAGMYKSNEFGAALQHAVDNPFA